MEITRDGIDTVTGPSDWFTGAVFIDAVAAPSGARGSTRATSTSRRARVRRGTRT